MNYSEKLINLRNEVLDELTNSKIFYESDLDERWENQKLEDLYYDLPTTTYYDKHGFGFEVKILGFENGFFICHEMETGEIHNIESAWVSTDALVEYVMFLK